MSGLHDPELTLELSRIASRIPGTASRPARGTAADPEAEPSLEQLMTSITVFGDLARVSAELEGQAVRAAHESGATWAQIGRQLGISRQAVQQRFDTNYTGHSAPQAPTGGTRTLGPVSRAEELHHLNEAGSQGWRLIRSLWGEHVLRREEGPWEVRRVSMLLPLATPSPREGWQAAATRFPDCFFIREATIEVTTG